MGAYPYRAAVADLGGEDKPDLVMANASTPTISVFRNLSTAGTFTTASLGTRVDYPTALSPRIIAIADIDGNGLPDLATPMSASLLSPSRGMLGPIRRRLLQQMRLAGTSIFHVIFRRRSIPREFEGTGGKEVSVKHSASSRKQGRRRRTTAYPSITWMMTGVGQPATRTSTRKGPFIERGL